MYKIVIFHLPPKWPILFNLSVCVRITNYESQRLIHKDYGLKLDAERSRRYDIILKLIYDEARNRGKVYTINTFCEVFENKAGLGSKKSIRERIDVLAAKCYIKFNRKDKNAERSKYGILCVEDMEKKVVCKFVTSLGCDSHLLSILGQEELFLEINISYIFSFFFL